MTLPRYIIGICGKAGSGKTTAAMHLQDLGLRRIAFADPIKEFAVQYFGCTREEAFRTKPPHVRTMLQGIGTMVREQFDEHFFTGEVFNKIKYSDALGVVIDDLRFPNEAEMIRSLGGVIIQMVCPDAPDVLTVAQAAHESETHTLTPDFVIEAEYGDFNMIYGQIGAILNHIDAGAAND